MEIFMEKDQEKQAATKSAKSADTINQHDAQLGDTSEPCRFRLLQGGLSETSADSSKKFAEAYITDTRLMGVTVLCVHWQLPENMLNTHLYQFFRFDAEEFGLDEYSAVLGPADNETYDAMHAVELKLVGGLGARKNMLTERELRFLVQSYIDYNLSHKIPLPDGLTQNELDFLLAPRIDFSDVEEYVLMCKQCPLINSPYQTINYFLMRCIGRDFPAAKFLTQNYVRTDLFSEFPAATLLRNVIDEDNDEQSGSNSNYYATDSDKDFGTFKTRKSFLCESLIETDGRYFILVTRLTLDQLKVVKYERISAFPVSLWEASLLLTAPEYVSVFDIVIEDFEIDEKTIPLLSQSMMTEHENGRLFMIFYPHNDHVSRQTYRMSDDVFGLCYVLDSGQIVLSSSERRNVSVLEQEFMKSGISPLLIHTAKYAFDNPVISDFINSGCDDFEEFVHMISESDDDI